MHTYIKIGLLALFIASWLPRDTAIAEPYIEPFVKQVIVTAKREKPLKMNCELLRPILAKYDWDVDMALKISNAESGCNPTNHNYKDNHRDKNGNTICLGSWNVFSVGCVNYKKGENIDDLDLNVKKAYNIYSESKTFKKWSTCKNIIDCK